MTDRSQGRKKSNFLGQTTILGSDTFDFVRGATNFKIPFSDFVLALGVTGTIVQDGAVTGTPVLDVAGSVNNIRNLEDGSGVKASVSAENGITLDHNFTQDTTGVAVLGSPTATSPIIRSIVGGDNITATLVGDSIEIDTSTVSLDNRVVVKTASDLSGTLDSAKEYFIDGIIDMGSQSIEVPQGGLNLTGYNFDISQLTSSATSYTMFTSPVGGSGNLLGVDYGIEVSGAGSKVYELVSDTGDEAFEFARINYNDCTSLGSIDNYRQGLEEGSGRFGGSPSLELVGAWAGGYRITTSIVRSLDAGMTEPLFKAGAAFVMQSRFLTDINVDLPASAAFLDFAPGNFANPSTLQIQGVLITRNGVSDPEDSNLTPNIEPSDLASTWSNNQGLRNTFVGGVNTITAEVLTTISTINTLVDLAGTWTPTDLQHFDEPSNGQLRHLGDNPREFRLTGDFVVEGTSGETLTLQITKFDSSSSTFSSAGRQFREVNNLAGGRNVAFFTMNFGFTLDQNDYVIMQVENNTSTNNVTVELDSSITVMER